MKQSIRVGIIGFGLSGRYFFAPFIKYISGFHLHTIVSSQNELINSEYPDVNVVVNVEELFTNSEIDLVVIASPNYTHFNYAAQALNAGKHVIIEKPFTTISKEADTLIEIAQRKQLMLIPFQNRRWDAEHLTLKKVIKTGKLGEILEYESHFDRYRPQDKRTVWKAENLNGNGVLYDLGPHLIDQALDLFGEPDSIYADLKILREGGKVIDTVEVHLLYRSLKVILKAGVFVKETGPRIIVHGRKGSFVKYGLDPQEMNLRNGMRPKDGDLGEDLIPNYGVLHYEEDGNDFRENIRTVSGNYILYFENVRDAILGISELIVTPSQGRNIIKVIELAQQSNREKKVIDFND